MGLELVNSNNWGLNFPTTFGLGYNASNEELFQASRGKKRKCIGKGMSILHNRVTFLAPVEVIRSKLAQEVCEEE